MGPCLAPRQRLRQGFGTRRRRAILIRACSTQGVWIRFNATVTALPDRPAPNVPADGVNAHTAVDIDLWIGGHVEGPVSAPRRSVVIEASACVRGDLTAGRVTIHGSLIGDLEAGESVTVMPGARVQGDIRTPVLSVQDGARLAANIRVAGAARSGNLGREESGASPKG